MPFKFSSAILGIVIVDTIVGSELETIPESLKIALQRVGANSTAIRYRQPYCFINMVQSQVDWKQESLWPNATAPSNCAAVIY